MEILAISDIHADWPHFLPSHLSPADLVLIAGDITESGLINPQEIAQAARWLTALGQRYSCVLWIPGNHDVGIRPDTFILPENVQCILDRTVTYSHDSQTITVHGVSLSPAYETPQMVTMFDYMTIDPAAEQRAFDFEAVDIVVSHGPPFQMLDSMRPQNLTETPSSIGSHCLADYIKRHAPRLVVCGHVHDAAGQMQVGRTSIVNAARQSRLLRI